MTAANASRRQRQSRALVSLCVGVVKALLWPLKSMLAELLEESLDFPRAICRAAFVAEPFRDEKPKPESRWQTCMPLLLPKFSGGGCWLSQIGRRGGSSPRPLCGYAEFT
jgi:hypothetical protein